MLVSPHRTDRPWQGEVNKTSGFSDLHYDPQCYLCPGNTRAGGKVTPKYESVYVFDNDYPALLSESPALHRENDFSNCCVRNASGGGAGWCASIPTTV